MDPQLADAYKQLINQYPPVVKDAISRAMSKAHDVARNSQQSAVRDEILDAVTDGLSTDGAPNVEAIALVIECHGEDKSDGSE